MAIGSIALGMIGGAALALITAWMVSGRRARAWRTELELLEQRLDSVMAGGAAAPVTQTDARAHHAVFDALETRLQSIAALADQLAALQRANAEDTRVVVETARKRGELTRAMDAAVRRSLDTVGSTVLTVRDASHRLHQSAVATGSMSEQVTDALGATARNIELVQSTIESCRA